MRKYDKYDDQQLLLLRYAIKSEMDVIYKTVQDFTVDAITTSKAMAKLEPLASMLRSIKSEMSERRAKKAAQR